MKRGKRTPEKAFGAALRALRKEKGMSQEALSFESGFDRGYIGMLERGESSPTIRTLYKLAGALGCSVIEFLDRMERRDLA